MSIAALAGLKKKIPFTEKEFRLVKVPFTGKKNKSRFHGPAF